MTPLLTKLDELEKLAKAATPGDRIVVDEEGVLGTYTWATLDGRRWLSKDPKLDAEFHAAADPETILELCQTLREAVEVIEFYADANRGYKAREFLEKVKEVSV